MGTTYSAVVGGMVRHSCAQTGRECGQKESDMGRFGGYMGPNTHSWHSG